MNCTPSIPDQSICAVIVTYRYPLNQLHQLLTSISNQVDHVCLVDNNDLRETDDGLAALRDKNCTVIDNRINLGLAKAINQGIRFAIEKHYEYVLLMDQDSRPASDMVEKLAAAWRNRTARGEMVAAVGPVVMDQHQGKPLPFLQFKPTRTKKISPPLNSDALIPVDFLISSGSLLNLDVLMNEGLMDETLFIDNIDLEWCFRMKKSGYLFYGVPNAFLYHRLGETVVRLPVLERFVCLHGPERQYYIMRNRLLLYNRNYVPFHWKINDFPRLLFKFVFFSLFVSPRRRNAAMMVQGFKDGIFYRRKKTFEVTKT